MPVIPNTLAEISRLSDDNKGIFPLPLSNAAFTFDSFGIAGFFGGENALAGMATVNLIPGHRWCGWYNNPGSYEIAKRYGALGKLKLCDALFPEGDQDPAHVFKLDGPGGPPFVPVHSGISQSTGQIARLFAQWAADRELYRRERFSGRVGARHDVTIVHLGHIPPGATQYPDLPKSSNFLFSLLPNLVSVGGCVLCALVADWFAFASIAIGIVAHGFACCVIGSGKLEFVLPKLVWPGPGNGVLNGDENMVILIGPEGAVNAVTRSRFRLRYGTEPSQVPRRVQPERGDAVVEDEKRVHNAAPSPKKTGNPPPSLKGVGRPDDLSSTSLPNDSVSSRSLSRWSEHMRQWCSSPPQYLIGHCAILLMLQFLAQLVLIPLSTLFGQLMFIMTVIASWLYSVCLSVSCEEIQTKILLDMLQLQDDDRDVRKYRLETWTATVAFASFVLASSRPLDDAPAFLNGLLPHDTVIWTAWKAWMATKLKADQLNMRPEFTENDLSGMPDKPRRDRLETLFRDVQNAWDAYSAIRPWLLRDQGDSGRT
ncbi:hypothetical protein GSI_03664 [Ganoderma sinense ZZ0214-1]|uniref:Uncharacterized protein n=1 Tax=Ganoderma sinense ZZ0214-1 TaxID=1077348 RepID=A0A2G8SJL0_9APHY|nr:hypothetical protein GSI_03664 [Ganoderma sinense ZZ0214-1]